MAQVHLSTQKGMAFIALEWCYQDLRESGRGNIKFDKKRKDRLEETLLVCVCVFFGHNATCVY